MPAGNTVVVRIDYDGPSGNLGYIELSRTPPPEGSAMKADYWIITEHTHLPGKLLPSAVSRSSKTSGRS